MTRKYKIKRRKKNFLLKLFPEKLQSFVAKRLVDSTGIIVALLGLSCLVAILSYQHTDPSFNTAVSTDYRIHNWLGFPGAALSDALIQTFGLSSLVFSSIIACWGASIFVRRPLPSPWSCTTFLILSILTSSVALARIPSGDWFTQAYLGGSAGTLMLDTIANSLQNFGLSYPHMSAAILAALLSCFAFCFAIGVTREEWSRFLSTSFITLYKFSHAALQSILSFYQWVRHHDSQSAPRKHKKQPFISGRNNEAGEEVPSHQQTDEQVTPYASSEAGEEKAKDIKVIKNKIETVGKAPNQQRFQLFEGGDWELPSIDLLQEQEKDTQEQLDENALRMNAELLQSVLNDFNVKGEIVSIHPGPVVTLYEFEPAPGTKSSRVIGLADDIARSMSAVSVRAAVVPGRNVIGIELPNTKRAIVFLRDLIMTKEYERSQAKLPLILGKDIGGKPIIADLSRMPHLLVAGTTGAGKSVAVNTMILSLLYKLPPEKCRFIMIDPKMLELSVYNDIPHLLSPVVTEPGRAIVALKWTVQEMEERYRSMSKLGVRNIEGYNARLAQARKKGEVLMRKVQTGFDAETGKPVYEEQPLDLTELPYIVVVVDEFADLMLVAGKEVENAIQRLAQMARAAGIHIIMATQRPSVDVITGVIKANFPTRVSFAVTSKIDSRTILGEGGAEQLLGMGDMLYMASGGQIKRVHGPFSSDEDVESVVNFLKSQAEPAYLDDITDDANIEGGLMDLYGEDGAGSDVDELYDQAVAIVARERKASTSFIQRHLQIGYNRAARIVEEMEKQGVIGPANHVGKREILVGDHSET